MKNSLANLFYLPWVLLLCGIGCAAALTGCRRIDGWCARQLAGGAQ